MPKLYLLHEAAIGYALFEGEEFEDIGANMPSVQAAVQDLAKFGKICKLHAFVPFTSAQNALENINAVSEGVVHPLLKSFLEAKLPAVKNPKKAKYALGVNDHRLGQQVRDDCNIPCLFVGIVPEMLRGVRRHFAKLIKSVGDEAVEKAQLGLGHSYSRCKVKFNVHRADNMIIQAISILDQMDKDINTFSMRIKEWYGYHFPELTKIVPDNHEYAKVVQFVKRRSSLSDESVEKLEEILMDSGRAQMVLDASRHSMGMDVSEIDLLNIDSFARRVVSLGEYRKTLHEYLVKKMSLVAPNLATLIGEQVGARLISHAGSLTNLAKYPASTVQILGAEKALFRALKTKSNTPKYGLIFHSSFIGRAGTKNKGRISRYLANKASIASRIDCFTDEPSTKFGEKLREQVEERLEFYDTGKTPRKNLDVMREVIGEVDGGRKRKAADEGDQTEDADVSKTLKKKKDKGEKKSKKSEKGSKKVKGDKKEKKSKKEKEGKKKSKKSKKEAMEVE
mmetsp:Transcript_35312/g.92343  ORF Transcript_35312/g.92343 Transcript_35312/m.92343 type:complete len:508 (+) Transcript_35312:174-1697(+)